MFETLAGEELIKVEKKGAEDLKNVCGKQGGTAPSPRRGGTQNQDVGSPAWE